MFQDGSEWWTLSSQMKRSFEATNVLLWMPCTISLRNVHKACKTYNALSLKNSIMLQKTTLTTQSKSGIPQTSVPEKKKQSTNGILNNFYLHLDWWPHLCYYHISAIASSSLLQVSFGLDNLQCSLSQTPID